jgi:hypothetical protein
MNEPDQPGADGPDITPIPPRRGVPWEREGPFWWRLGVTILGVLFFPRRFFQDMEVTAPIWLPFAFALLVRGVLDLLSILIFLAFYEGSLEIKIRSAITPYLLISLPLQPLISAGIKHLFVMLVRGNRRGFRASFRVVFYSTAVAPLSLVPLVGRWVALIWGIVAEVIGMARVHGMSHLRAFVAVFVAPFCLGMFIVIVVLVLGLLGMMKLDFILGPGIASP